MPRRQAADHEKAAAVTANTTDALPTASRTPPRAGPANMPTLEIVLIETLAAGQFLRCSRERGEQRLLCRMERRRDDGGRDRERVDEERRAVQGRDGRHPGEERDAHEVGCEHHEAPGEPVGRQGEPGGEERREPPAREADRGHGSGPACVVRVDRDRDRVGPAPEGRAGRRELEAAQQGVCDDLRQCPKRLGELSSEAHPREDGSGCCVFEGLVGRFLLCPPS